MARHSPAVRALAVALALFPGLAGPGSALTHGVAHEREHHAAEHRPIDHHDGGDRLVAPAISPDDAGGSHEHRRLDAPTVSRLVTSALMPARPVAVPVSREALAAVGTPVVARPFRPADPPTGPPPPARAPPLG